MEDVLTSNVFGLLRYLPPRDGLLPFLRRAETVDRHRPLETLLGDGDPIDSDLYTFWPWLHEPDCDRCQPDLLIRLNYPDGRRFRIAVEAKYRSGKSSLGDDEDDPEGPPKDQLAKQWSNLVQMARKESARPLLIYLTAHVACPVGQIQDSIREYKLRRPADAEEPAILFLSWRHIPEVFGTRPHPVLADVCKLAERFGLRFFHGVPAPKIEPITWSFDRGPHVDVSSADISEVTPRTVNSKIVAAFCEMQHLYPSFGRLLETGEMLLNQRDWRSVYSMKYCPEEHGGSITFPQRWQPFSFIRMYVSAQHPLILSFVSIIIDTESATAQQPGVALLSTGGLWFTQPNGWKSLTLTRSPKKAPSPEKVTKENDGFMATKSLLHRWHLFRSDRKDDGQLRWHEPFYWLSNPPNQIKEASGRIVKAATMALPIEELQDAHDVESRVVLPLLNWINATEPS